MKKVLNFILSFLQPKKMIRFRNLNLFVIVLIFLSCTILCVEASNLTLNNYIKKNKESFRLFPEVYELTSNQKVQLPKFTIDQETGKMTNFTIGEEEDNIYEFTFDLDGGKTLNLILVYEDKVSLNDDETTDVDERILNFDLNGYYNHEPKRDAEGNLLEEDMLFIITNELIYYIFNRGYDLNKNEDGTYTKYLESTGWSIKETKYVLPKDATEIEFTDSAQEEVDYSKWTAPALFGETKVIGDKTYTAYSLDEDAYFLPANEEEANSLNSYNEPDITKWTLYASKDEKKIINGIEYTATTRLKKNIHEIFVGETSTRVGVFSLYQATNVGIDFGNLDDTKVKVNPVIVVEAIANLMVNLGSNQLESYNLLYALIFMVFMPLLWTFATWVMAKKFGELTRYKEYYAICAISFIPTTILIALFSMLVEPYAFIAQYAMFIQVGFYIFCIYRINSMYKNKAKSKDEPKKTITKKEEVNLEVETTPIVENINRTATME